MKKIGIDARFFGEAGPGRYTKDIVEHLEKLDTTNKYFIFLRKKNYNNFNPKNPNFIKVLADYSWYSFAEQTLFLIKILKYRLDLYYVPHFNIPIFYPFKLVTAIPDMIMHTYSTEKGTTLPKPYFKFKKLVYKVVFLWAVIRSKKIIVPTKDVIEDFKKIYPYINSSKYVLAYEGVDPDLLQLDPAVNPQAIMNKYHVQKPFLLYVGSAYEHKNIPILVDAFKLLVEKYNFLGQLLIVGKKDKFSQRLKNYVDELGLSDKVLLPGLANFVIDKEVVALRTQAVTYVFPSLKEGFSLTPMEAQVLGIPSVISNISCHQEIYGDSVQYFDPYNKKDIAQKINLVLTNEDLKQKLIQKGYETVKKFNWEETARITLDVFEKA
ncbi:MAG: Glycosyl transferase, group 1 [uncultured bacterium]|nr:MAG: Glycosyl transferase, group 1 [uncultured bacterium]